MSTHQEEVKEGQRFQFGENWQSFLSQYKKNRGMSITHNWVDWLGGLPFQVATVEEIFFFFRDIGFVLYNIRTTNRLGNNQFVFVRGSH